ncbi:MAG: calcium-binding protein [Pseudomonadota bacterium]
MANFSFLVSFSMPDFNGFRAGIDNETLAGFEIINEIAEEAVFFTGDFSLRTSFILEEQDDIVGPIRSVFGGTLVVDEESEATAVVSDFRGTSLDVGKRDVESALLTRDPIEVFKVLLEDDDRVDGSPSADVLFSFGGDDRLLGFAGSDELFGGLGEDTVLGGAGADNVNGGLGDDLVRGGGGEDKVRGQAGDDKVVGQGGDDALFGAAGDDILRGGAGDDRIFGGAGDDDLRGGGGDDRFVFNAVSGEDVVGDFQQGSDELRILTATDFADLTIDVVGGDSVITFEEAEITIVGVTGLTAGDFIF